MKDGKRFENMSWRLWSKQTVYRAPDASPSTRNQRLLDGCNESFSKLSLPLPDLSSSVDSRLSSVDTSSSKGQTRHLTEGQYFSQLRVKEEDECYTPVDLQRIVNSIKEKEQTVQPVANLSQSLYHKHPNFTVTQSPSQRSAYVTKLSAAAVPAPDSSVSTVATMGSSQTPDSATRQPSKGSTSTEASSHGVVRGFSPSCISSSYRSQSHFVPETCEFPKQSAQASIEMPKKKTAKFMLGCSSDEGGESPSEPNTFQARSYLSEELKKSSIGKKQEPPQSAITLGRQILDRAYESEEVFESGDDEDDCDDDVSESAIDDNDDEAWEDSDTEDVHARVVEEKDYFRRDDSHTKLTSRRSLLTTMMHEKDRKQELASIAAMRPTSLLRRSRTTSPNGPSLATSPDDAASHVNLGARPIPQPKPIIMTTSNLHAPPYSPRTTRRNMLTTELTESLRKHILWERQQKNVTANAALKRRHTSQDVKNLRQYPRTNLREQVSCRREDTSKRSSLNNYFDNGLQEYHQKGW